MREQLGNYCWYAIVATLTLCVCAILIKWTWDILQVPLI